MKAVCISHLWRHLSGTDLYMTSALRMRPCVWDVQAS